MGWGLRVETRKARCHRAFRAQGVWWCSSGTDVTDRSPLVLAHTEHGRSMGGAGESLPEQFVGHPGHRLAAALALAVKRADHVVGQTRGIQGAWHGLSWW